MILLFILGLFTLVLFALFLGGGLVAQGYLYQEPANRLPLRALVGAVLVSAFITMWVSIDRRAPKKYDTFFEFSPHVTKEFSEFEAIRWVSTDGTRPKKDDDGKRLEVTVKFKKGSGSKSDVFIDEATHELFQLNSSGKSGESFMTAAIRAKVDPETEPVRFQANVKDDGKSGAVTYLKGPEGLRFSEVGGSRYVQADQLGTVYVPSTWGVVLALLINFLHFVVWFVAFWPIMQFTRGHAFILATAFMLITMLLVMPLLFGQARQKKAAPEAPKAALINHVVASTA